ncbi:MAG: hypothetical protein IJA38_00005 [Bacteroidales bacterium]|nr:hypothetical protein [Bacteroidales bacterium]
MKKILYTFILSAFAVFFTNGANAQETKVHVKEIPINFMKGSFNFAIAPGDLIQYQDTANRAMLNTYYLLSHMMLGLKCPDKLIDSTLIEVEKIFGTENMLYGLALIPKAIEEDKNIALLDKATQIIKESEGDASWEYAFALLQCANTTLDIDKYKTSEKSLAYMEKCLAALEGYKDNWLYALALSSRGLGKLYAQDELFIDDIMESYNLLLNSGNPELNLIPFAYSSITFGSVCNIVDLPDKALTILLPVIEVFKELELEKSEHYISLCATLCHSYSLTKDKKKAKGFLMEAEQACIARFGKNSKQYRKLDSYRKLL